MYNKQHINTDQCYNKLTFHKPSLKKIYLRSTFSFWSDPHPIHNMEEAGFMTYTAANPDILAC